MTQSANDMQVGGNHYKARPYQHWDFVCDTGMHYLLGCFTKYVSRWRAKNGIQDLEKSLHYLKKAEERLVLPPVRGPAVVAYTNRFADQHDAPEKAIIRCVMEGDYIGAVERVKALINSET
jgi:hypothetical protein